jgi:hypothetical protein
MEDIGYRSSGPFLNQRIRIDKSGIQSRGESFSYFGFSGPAKSG